VTPDAPVRLTIPADASFLTVCRAALSGILTDAGDDEVEESKLVLSEVCAAAVAHGDGDVLDVEFRTTPGWLEIEVTGAGADTFVEDPVALEVVERLTSRWRVDSDRVHRPSVTFARRLR
jgi:anti-sigma regulatory factor (Ser/Thr protein kinase)